MQGKTLNQLAECVGGKIVGNGKRVITAAAIIETAGPDEITFLVNKKYIPQLATTNAGAVITAEQVETKADLLIADDPYYAFMQIVVLLHGHRKHPQCGISKHASIDKSAKVGDGCNVAQFAIIRENTTIGANCNIYPGVFIGPDVKIGDDCIIYPNAVIYDKTQIGSGVIIHAGASVGQDGFGFATHKGVHHKIPQVGKVILEDNVEIGAGAAIERATLADTIIGTGCKIGDLVAIGHGAKIGPGCLLVPLVGIAGSTTLGHHCVLGGQVGISGHIKIGNMVKIGAQSGISNNIPDGKTVLGSPAMDANYTKRIWAAMQHLPELNKRIKKLEKKLEK